MVAQVEAPASLQVGVRLRRFIDPSQSEAFEGVVADTQSLRHACFRVRHQVYCCERHFESPSDHPNGLETDEFDPQSLHALIRHRRSGESVGTVRLVLPHDNGSPHLLPMYSVLHDVANASFLPPACLTAEISRFAISKDTRRRIAEGHVTAITADEQQMMPQLVLSLMSMVLRMKPRTGIEYLCAMMEPTLLRMLRRFAIVWQPVGPLLEYHGLRQPCIARIDDMAATMAAERPDLWELTATAAADLAATTELAAA